MWRQILHIWLIAYVSATGTQDAQSPMFNLQDILKPGINIMEMIVLGYLKNSTEKESEYEKASLQFLKRNIVDELHYPSYVCDSPYKVACDWYWVESNRPSEKELIREPLQNQLTVLKNEIQNLLKSPVLETDSKSLAVEKQLYQDCMKLGEKTPIQKSQSIVDYTLSDFIENVTSKPWQYVDEKLGSMGFGYTFFNVSAVVDKRTNKKILLMQPPSKAALLKSIELFLQTEDKLKIHSNHKNELLLAMHFMVSLTKAYDDNFTVEKFSIMGWNRYYLEGNGGKLTPSSEIHWYQLLSAAGKNLGVHRVFDVLVQNKEYFQQLERLLRIFSKDLNIASLVVFKWLPNNIRYVNWDAYYQLHNKDKNSLCLEELELYGVSQVIRQFLEVDTDIKFVLEKARTILGYIVKTIEIDIFVSQNLKDEEKTMLKAYLYDITAPILKSQTNSAVADDFYGNFTVTHQYFKDIVEFRKRVDAAESRFVNKYGWINELPFNLNDLSVPQNHLLLKAYFQMHLMVSPYLHKEYHYGVYGTEMARYIYEMIISKKLSLNKTANNDLEMLLPSIKYPDDYKHCLKGKVPEEEIDTIISEVVALETAYESMLQNYLHDFEMRKPFIFDSGVKYSEDAIFILSYLKNHCFWYGDKGKHVIKSFKRTSSAFGCNYQHQCNIAVF